MILTRGLCDLQQSRSLENVCSEIEEKPPRGERLSIKDQDIFKEGPHFR